MIVGFKGESSKLKELYKELGLKEVKVNTFEELEDVIKNIDGNTVIENYNEVVVFDQPTADLVEKRSTVFKLVSSSKHNIYLSLTKDDPSLDKLQLDYCICTKMNINDIKLIEEIYNFCNTDLPYSGKLSDDEYAVRGHSDNRAEAKSLADVKKLLK